MGTTLWQPGRTGRRPAEWLERTRGHQVHGRLRSSNFILWELELQGICLKPGEPRFHLPSKNQPEGGPPLKKRTDPTGSESGTRENQQALAAAICSKTFSSDPSWHAWFFEPKLSTRFQDMDDLGTLVVLLSFKSDSNPLRCVKSHLSAGPPPRDYRMIRPSLTREPPPRKKVQAQKGTNSIHVNELFKTCVVNRSAKVVGFLLVSSWTTQQRTQKQ